MFRHADVICLCASYGSSQCCVLHDLQFVNAGRGCNRRPYRRGILQSRSHNCFIGMLEVISLFRSLRAGSQVFALLMLFLCVILHIMWSGKNLQLLYILPFGMLCLSAISILFVKIMLVGMVV